jgi:endonuclease YncB( thermonuclease family)
MIRNLAWLACLLLLTGPALAADGDVVSGPVRAIDADIIMVNDQRVILYGVDAPERSQFCFVGNKKWGCWDAAMSALRTILEPGTASCTLSGEPDPFNRRYGVCTVDGKDVGAELVRSGMAMAFLDQGDDYAEIEQQARTAEVGLWQPRAKVDAPWVWRKRNPGGYR